MTKTRTPEEIRQEMNAVRLDLSSNPEAAIKQLRKLDKELTTARKMELLNNVNRDQERKRTLAAAVWELEEPAEDITTNDSYFHKTKVKKYPKIAALPYTSATWDAKAGKLIKIRHNGEKFKMYREEYPAAGVTTYHRPASFTEFLQLNHILPEAVTLEQFEELEQKIKAANDELLQQIEQYKQKINALNIYPLECANLFSQRAEYLYFKQSNA